MRLSVDEAKAEIEVRFSHCEVEYHEQIRILAEKIASELANEGRVKKESKREARRIAFQISGKC